MTAVSAGTLLFRQTSGAMEILLVHPGGPFWRNKHEGFWQIPKGLIEEDEDPAVAALREFEEETGGKLTGDLLPLQPIRQKAGKVVLAFAVEGNLDAGSIMSGTFELEWPPRSGKISHFPEVDQAAWYTLEEAHRMMLPGQRPLLDDLVDRLDAR